MSTCLKTIGKMTVSVIWGCLIVGCTNHNQTTREYTPVNDSSAAGAYIHPRYLGKIEKQQQKLKRYIEKNDIPSVSIGVAKNGEIIWEQGFGMANMEKNILASQYISYPLASVSKNLTATGLMTLVEKGFAEVKHAQNYRR